MARGSARCGVRTEPGGFGYEHERGRVRNVGRRRHDGLGRAGAGARDERPCDRAFGAADSRCRPGVRKRLTGSLAARRKRGAGKWVLRWAAGRRVGERCMKMSGRPDSLARTVPDSLLGTGQRGDRHRDCLRSTGWRSGGDDPGPLATFERPGFGRTEGTWRSRRRG